MKLVVVVYWPCVENFINHTMITKKKSKGTPLDAQQRLTLILQRLAEGKSRLEIQNELQKKYGVSQTTLNSDFLKALAELKKQQEPFVSEIKSVIADRYETLWTAALERGDLKTATNVLKQESELFGLNIQKQEVDLSAGEFEITFN